MVYSDDYLRQLGRNIHKSGGIEPDMVRTLFFQYVSELPEELRWDIFNLLFGEPETEQSLEKAEHLSVVIDLFEGEYEEAHLKITDDELKYISEGVNDYALDLSDDILMNVMRAAVSRGLMG
jgi:hypothetical protein